MIANIARIQKAHDTEMQVIKLLFGHPLKSKYVASTWPSTSALSVSTNAQKVHIFVQNMTQMLRKLYSYYQRTQRQIKCLSTDEEANKCDPVM